MSAYTATRPSVLVYVTGNIKAVKNPYIIDKDNSGCDDLDIKQDLTNVEDSEGDVDSGYSLEIVEDLTNDPLNVA